MRVILASKSPRRKELLGALAKEMGFEFEIITEEIDETLDKDTATVDGVRILAEKKGAAVAKREDLAGALVISSDTLVERDGVALGKPADREEALSMLRSLSGRGHFVRTGVAVSYLGKTYSGVASTEVVFVDIPDLELIAYVDSGECMDKAGAYGIQGGAGKFVKEYRGDFDTVVGLSLALTRELIEKALGGFNFE